MKEWLPRARDSPRPPGVGGSGARRVVGEKSRDSIARAADGACASGWLRTCVRAYVRACVRAYVRERERERAIVREQDGGRAAGDNDGDKARPADGRSERNKSRGGRREARRSKGVERSERTSAADGRRREWTSKCDGERTREKDGVALYQAGDVSQDRKSVAGILGLGLLHDNASC